jgi:hypothetical protein
VPCHFNDSCSCGVHEELELELGVYWVILQRMIGTALAQKSDGNGRGIDFLMRSISAKSSVIDMKLDGNVGVVIMTPSTCLMSVEALPIVMRPPRP